MPSRVVAIAVDSTDYAFLDHFFEQGHLPCLAKLRARSTLTRLVTETNFFDGASVFSGTEGNWVMFQTGVRPESSGYWDTISYCPDTYRTTNDFTHGGYDYKDYPPFYALGDRARVATFDIPVSAVVPDVQGRQLVGWGGHFPYVVRGSNPRGLMEATNRRFGKNRIIYRDHGVFWSRRYRTWLEQTVIQATKQRQQIILDMMEDSSLDLIVAAFSETHSALHDLWAQSDEDHPVKVDEGQHNPLLEVFTAIDEAIGSVVEHLRPDDHFVLFSVHGMQPNSTDLPCLFFLSELMYRFNFPGKFGFARGGHEEEHSSTRSIRAALVLVWRDLATEVLFVALVEPDIAALACLVSLDASRWRLQVPVLLVDQGAHKRLDAGNLVSPELAKKPILRPAVVRRRTRAH